MHFRLSQSISVAIGTIPCIVILVALHFNDKIQCVHSRFFFFFIFGSGAYYFFRTAQRYYRSAAKHYWTRIRSSSCLKNINLTCTHAKQLSMLIFIVRALLQVDYCHSRQNGLSLCVSRYIMPCVSYWSAWKPIEPIGSVPILTHDCCKE